MSQFKYGYKYMIYNVLC